MNGLNKRTTEERMQDSLRAMHHEELRNLKDRNDIMNTSNTFEIVPRMNSWKKTGLLDNLSEAEEIALCLIFNKVFDEWNKPNEEKHKDDLISRIIFPATRKIFDKHKGIYLTTLFQSSEEIGNEVNDKLVLTDDLDKNYMIDRQVMEMVADKYAELLQENKK